MNATPQPGELAGLPSFDSWVTSNRLAMPAVDLALRVKTGLRDQNAKEEMPTLNTIPKMIYQVHPSTEFLASIYHQNS